MGDSPDEFYLARGGRRAAYRVQCGGTDDPRCPGGEAPDHHVQGPAGSRQAARLSRFRVFAYDEAHVEGLELKVGDTVTFVQQRTGQLITAKLLDVNWTVYLANKKASWYRFQELDGEHGYSASHPLRNPEITDNETRRRLIIDPGPQSVSYLVERRQTAKSPSGPIPGRPSRSRPRSRPLPSTTWAS